MLTLERIKSLPRDITLSNDYRVLSTECLEKRDNEYVAEGVITFCIDSSDDSYMFVEYWSALGKGKLTKSFNVTEYFADWLNSTPEENTLWTLETGLEPIETYVEQMEKMMKEFKQCATQEENGLLLTKIHGLLTIHYHLSF